MPRYSALGEFAGYIGSCIDITDMKEAANALEVTRAFFESAAEGILIVDHAGRIVRMNERGEDMFGYVRAELIGMPVEALLPERFRSAHREHRADYFEAPRTRPMGLGRH